MMNNVLSVRMREPCQCKALCVINECLDGNVRLLSLSFDEATLLPREAVSTETAASCAIMAITAVVILVTESV